jgi:hypothetical protein
MDALIKPLNHFIELHNTKDTGSTKRCNYGLLKEVRGQVQCNVRLRLLYI